MNREEFFGTYGKFEIVYGGGMTFLDRSSSRKGIYERRIFSMQKKKYARMAALLAALIITGAGWMPARAAYQDWSTDGDGNLSYEIAGGQDSAPLITGGGNNVFVGDSWHTSESNNNWLVGNGGNSGPNLNHVNSSIVFGDNSNLVGNPGALIENALIIGDNAILNNVNTGTVIGNDNSIMSADDSMIIGNRVTITKDKVGEERISGISVIGNDVNVKTAGDNITVIGDHVDVDTTANRTDSSNSVIYGNYVTMTNSQNSVAMGNNIAVTGNGAEDDDNVAIGHGISLGQTGSGHSSGTVAMGDHISVNGADNVVLGGDIDLGDSALNDVVVIGHRADTTGIQSVTIGEGASSGTVGVAVGGESQAMENSAAFGFQAVANAGETTVIGPYSTVNSSYSTALGNNVRIGSSSKGSVSIGGHSEIGDNAQYAIAIGGSGGGQNLETGEWTEDRTTIGDGATAAIAMGYGATIADNTGDSIALGTGASVNAPVTASNDSARGIAIGHDAAVTGKYSTAIGDGAQAAGWSAIAIGDGAKTTKTGTNGQGSIAVGMNATVDSQDGVAVGTKSSVANNAANSIAMGDSSTIGSGASNSLALGNKATISSNADSSMAMGDGSSVGSYYSMAFGYNASVGAGGGFSIAMGDGSSVANGIQMGLAIGGHQAIVNAEGGIALGSYTQVDSDYSVAVGTRSKATADDIFTADELEVFKAQLGAEYTDLYNIKAADISRAGVFSVGSAGGERRIINVARGRISEDSTDAVNGSQLYGAVKYLEGKIDEAGGGDVAIGGDDNITVTDTVPAADPGAGEGGTTEPGTGTGGSTGGETGSETGGTTGGTGSGSDTQSFTVNMTDNPVFGGHEKDEFGHSPDGSVIVTGSNGANCVAINENNEGGMVVTSGGETVNINKGGDGLVNGLKNTEWDWSKYEAGGYEGSTNAATESQLHELVGGIEEDITNMGDQITSMGDQITNIGNHVDELDGRINEVGAGAAALAALHPLDFDPDEKWDFAAGYGHYRGEDAVAIGAFYRPNEDTMFSIGGTVGNGDEMVNAGVSFKIGQGNHVSVSRVAMAKEIIELRKDLEDLRSAMASGVTGDTLDLSKIQLFPDTPENHWAYDYVATLAGNGILEGYPDGYFNGDRPITRYEMAAVLYRAMQKGVRLSEKALREFAPELDRIRVDTITKDDQGMPEIQRVRVVKGRE